MRVERRDLQIAIGLALFALVLRVAFDVVVDRGPDAFNDETFYHHAAETLANGQGLRSAASGPTAQWPPVFPFLLSIVYRITGPDHGAGEVFGAVVGALTVALLYVLARRLFGRREAIVAAGLLAVFPGQILWNEVLLAESVYALGLVGFLLLLQALPVRWWSAVVLGVAVGLAALTRGEGLLLVGVVLAAWWPELPKRALLGRVVVLAGVAVLTIAPWTIRNAVVMDAFIPISSNASITLYSGHNPRADGAQNYAPASLEKGLPAFGPRREVEEAKLLRREAVRYMVHNPKRELTLIPRKLVKLMRGDSYVLQWVNAARPGDPRPVPAVLVRPTRLLADISWFALLALTVAAVVVLRHELWRQRALRGTVALFVIALVTYGFVYYGNYRYRAPLEPLMLLVSAPLLVRGWNRVRPL